MPGVLATNEPVRATASKVYDAAVTGLSRESSWVGVDDFFDLILGWVFSMPSWIDKNDPDSVSLYWSSSSEGLVMITILVPSQDLERDFIRASFCVKKF